LEGESYNLCARFVRHSIDETTYTTLWELLDRRYGGQSKENQQVMEEFERVKVLDSYDLKEIQGLADCLISIRYYNRKVDPGSLLQPEGCYLRKQERS